MVILKSFFETKDFMNEFIDMPYFIPYPPFLQPHFLSPPAHSKTEFLVIANINLLHPRPNIFLFCIKSFPGGRLQFFTKIPFPFPHFPSSYLYINFRKILSEWFTILSQLLSARFRIPVSRFFCASLFFPFPPIPLCFQMNSISFLCYCRAKDFQFFWHKQHEKNIFGQKYGYMRN